MNALQQARGRLYLLHAAHDEGDRERVDLLLEQLGDDLDQVAREHRPRVGDHVCVTCDTVSDLKRAVRILQGHVLLLGHALRQERELVGMARTEIDRRFPQEEAA